MSKRILLIGGGGHCKSVLDTLLENNEYDEIGIIDKKECIGNDVFGVDFVGCDDDLGKLYKQGYTHAFISLGSIGKSETRKKIYKKLVDIGFEVPNIISKTAIIGKEVTLGIGIYIGKNVVINCCSKVEDCAIINTSVTIEHDCQIGEFAHIAPGSILCGNVKIGNNTHIGANSTIRQLLSVGNDSIVGIGSVVVANIGTNIIVYGNPCKEEK